MKLMIFIFGLLAFAPLGMTDAGFEDPASPERPSQETAPSEDTIRSTAVWELRNQINGLERRIARQDQEIRSLEDKVQQLDRQVRSLR